MKPKIQTKEQLLEALTFIREAIENDDSFEGSIQYAAAGRDKFEIIGFWRVGNSQGQGGSVSIGEME